jgi:hypothetical protein
MDRPERRTHPRMHYDWQMFLDRPGENLCDMGRMIDLSEVAARFAVSTDARVEPGTRVGVRFSHPYVRDDYGYEVRTVLQHAQVLRVRRTERDEIEVAVRLARPLHYGLEGQTFSV